MLPFLRYLVIMALRGSDMLWQHPTNYTYQTHMESGSDKKWSKTFPPIATLNVHTRSLGPNHSNAIEARVEDTLLPEMEDDAVRFAQPVYPPNPRQWRLCMEEDAINWFHTEISNPVLALFTTYPNLLQASHDKPIDLEVSHNETVDIGYSVSLMGQPANRRHLVIGEFKRCLITAAQWQAGKLTGAQRNFSQELRGYAYKYACPQILSFDGETLLMLQFRAAKVADIKDANCPVDCWVIPRANAGGTPLRYALYRFLVQGFRRCQGCTANAALQLNGVTARRRYFFNGVPVWKIDGTETDRPWGYQRRLHRDTGAFYWADSAGNALMDDNGAIVWDTLAFWGA